MEPIKLHVPHVRQLYEYDCGTAAVMSICKHNLINISHKHLMHLLETDQEGTKVKNIRKVLNLLGFQYDERHNMGVNELCHFINLGLPVICPLQAWGCGHYVVAIGHDENRVYFEDPYMNNTRGFIPKEDLKTRWNDVGFEGDKYDHYGIAIRNSSPKQIQVLTHSLPIPYNSP